MAKNYLVYVGNWTEIDTSVSRNITKTPSEELPFLLSAFNKNFYSNVYSTETFIDCMTNLTVSSSKNIFMFGKNDNVDVYGVSFVSQHPNFGQMIGSVCGTFKLIIINSGNTDRSVGPSFDNYCNYQIINFVLRVVPFTQSSIAFTYDIKHKKHKKHPLLQYI